MASGRSPPSGCSTTSSGSAETPWAPISLTASPWKAVVPMSPAGVPRFASAIVSWRLHDVTRLRQLRDELRRRRRGRVGFLAMHDGGHAVALAQQRAEVADEAVEVRLGVVEEADGAAVPALRQGRHGDRLSLHDADGAQDADLGHDLSSISS